MALTVGVPKEIKTAEHRVAMTPDGARAERAGVLVAVESGAGLGASIRDQDYVARERPSCPRRPARGRSGWSSR